MCRIRLLFYFVFSDDFYIDTQRMWCQWWSACILQCLRKLLAVQVHILSALVSNALVLFIGQWPRWSHTKDRCCKSATVDTGHTFEMDTSNFHPSIQPILKPKRNAFCYLSLSVSPILIPNSKHWKNNGSSNRNHFSFKTKIAWNRDILSHIPKTIETRESAHPRQPNRLHQMYWFSVLFLISNTPASISKPNKMEYILAIGQLERQHEFRPSYTWELGKRERKQEKEKREIILWQTRTRDMYLYKSTCAWNWLIWIAFELFSCAQFIFFISFSFEWIQVACVDSF